VIDNRALESVLAQSHAVDGGPWEKTISGRSDAVIIAGLPRNGHAMECHQACQQRNKHTRRDDAQARIDDRRADATDGKDCDEHEQYQTGRAFDDDRLARSVELSLSAAREQRRAGAVPRRGRRLKAFPSPRSGSDQYR
jgi:hypothetical protein